MRMPEETLASFGYEKGKIMLKIVKVKTLPATLEPETIYLISDGISGKLKITVSDKDGVTTASTVTRDELDAVIAELPVYWRNTLSDPGTTWGSTIYVLQENGPVWRVKKVDSSGNVTYSTSSAVSNQGVSLVTAWNNRQNLIYV